MLKYLCEECTVDNCFIVRILSCLGVRGEQMFVATFMVPKQTKKRTKTPNTGKVCIYCQWLALLGTFLIYLQRITLIWCCASCSLYFLKRSVVVFCWFGGLVGFFKWKILHLLHSRSCHDFVSLPKYGKFKHFSIHRVAVLQFLQEQNWSQFIQCLSSQKLQFEVM